MNFMRVVTLVILVTLPLTSRATPELTFKSFSVPLYIPKDVIKIISDEGTVQVDPKLSLTWVQNGHHHYFLQMYWVPKESGCRIVDVDQDSRSYNEFERFGQCKILGKPHLADLNADGWPDIWIKLSIVDIRSGDFYQKIVRAYLYVPQKSKFCQSDEAAGAVMGDIFPKDVDYPWLNCN